MTPCGCASRREAARWPGGRPTHVAALLRQADPALDVELVVVETLGDRTRDRPIHELGGQGVFVKEVQAAVLDGRADVAVHSAKDLPSIACCRVWSSRPCPSAATRAMPSSVAARRPAGRARRWRPARSAGGRSSRRPASRPSRSSSSAATSRPGCRKVPPGGRHRDGGRRARPPRARGPDRRGARPVGDAAAGRAGRARRRVPEDDDATLRGCVAHRARGRAAPRSMPSAPSSPSSAAGAICPSARTSRPIPAGGVARGSSPTWRRDCAEAHRAR